jgi:hypothetical protein
LKKLLALGLLILGSLSLMANGKIHFTPYPSRALFLPGIFSLLLAEEDNLIGVNPGFEMGDGTGWQATDGATLTVTSGDAYEGTHKAEITGVDMHVGLESVSPNIFNLLRGIRCKIIIPYKASATGESFNINIFDENNLPVIPVLSNTFAYQTGWKLAVVNFIPDRDYINCYLYIYSTQNSGVTYYFDKIILAQEYLDMGLDSFAIDLLHQPLLGTGLKTLAHKGPADLTADGAHGYHVYFNWSDYKYYLYLNDGTNKGAFASSAVTAIQNQLYHWPRVEIDRTAGLASFFANNVAAGTQDISAITGNLSNNNELRLFGLAGDTNLYKGFCDFVRFQRGAILPAAWRAAEWSRLQYGRLRPAPAAGALWEFDDNLLDRGPHRLLLAASGVTPPTYAQGWPYCVAPIIYPFAENFDWDFTGPESIPSDTIVRASETGAAYKTLGPRKNAYFLPFKYISEDQMCALKAAEEGGGLIDLWLDADQEQTARVFFDPDQPLRPRPQPALSGGRPTYHLDAYFVEA